MKGFKGMVGLGWQRRCASACALALITGLSVTPWELHGQSVLPTNPNVVSGTASVSTNGSAMQVVNSNGAVINWDSFSIGASNSVNFLQSGADSSVLNRVVGHNLSEIYGSLTSNGKVFLINQNGIFVGANATINTAGFFASTLDISNAEFKANNGNGTLHFVGNSDAAITNLGTINAVGGDVYLIAKHISNSGTISASEVNGKGGIVGAYATDELYLTTGAPDGGLVRVGSGSATGTGTGISNSGLINAVQADLKATGNLYAMAINNSGVIRATGASVKNGVVHLGVIGGTGKIIAGGEIHADGAAGSGGGKIDVRTDGDIDVTGTLTANATGAGDGGTVTVVAGGTTLFSGKIEALGAGADGKGGDAEVSGANLLVQGGLADLRGDGGIGMLTYDPGSIEIMASGTPDGVNTFLASALGTQLATANVTLATSSATNGQPEAITLDSGASIAWTGNTTLTLNSGGDITINGTITNTGNGSVVLHADTGATGTGTVTIPGMITVTGTTGTVKVYYNPANYLSSYGYASHVSTGAASNFTAYMLVNTATQLQAMATAINGGANTNSYALNANVDAGSLSGFLPMGNSTYMFSGNFDGLGHTISNLTINRAGINNIGLFGYVSGASGRGRIENVTLTNISVTGNNYVGALVGYNNAGTISNAAVSGTVTGGSYVGGLVGENYIGGVVTGSHADVAVTGTGYLGGLVGENSYTIANSYSLGAVTGAGDAVGGLAGNNNTNATISNSYATGTVTGGNNVGGLVGTNGSTASITSSYATGAVSATVGDSITASAGGLVSYNNGGSITDSYATGAVTLTDSATGYYANNFVGGLVGLNSNGGSITRSYAAGNVTVTIPDGSGNGDHNYNYVGGLVGANGADYFYQTFTGGSITASYATGTVTATGTTGSTNSVGGLVGQIYQGSVSGSYATGNVSSVSGNLANVGGLVGEISSGTVTTSYSLGLVASYSATYGSVTRRTGGLVGNNNGTVTYSYWNTETSDNNSGFGSGTATGATGLTSAQMLVSTNYSGSFLSSWNIVNGLTNPYLQWQSAVTGVTNLGSLSGTVVYANGTALTTAATYLNGSNYALIENGTINGKTVVASRAASTAAAVGSASSSLGSGFDLNSFTISVANGSSATLATALNQVSGLSTFYGVPGSTVTLASNITFALGSGATYTLDGNIASGTNTAVNFGSGTLIVSTASTVTASTITLNGTTVNANAALTLNATVNGLSISGSTITASNGLALNGTAVGGASHSVTGVSISGSTISTTAGTVAISGTGGNVTGGNYGSTGLLIQNASTISASGTGNVTLTGNAGSSGAGTSYGISLSASTVSTAAGTIALNGTGSTASGTSYGIYATSGATLANATGTTSLTGAAGLSSPNAYAVYAANSTLSLGTGTATVTATGGISFTGSTVTGTGLLTVLAANNALLTFGTASTGAWFATPSDLSGHTGNILIDGTGGGLYVGANTTLSDNVTLKGAISSGATVTANVLNLSGTGAVSMSLSGTTSIVNNKQGGPVTLTDSTASVTLSGSSTSSTTLTLTGATNIVFNNVLGDVTVTDTVTANIGGSVAGNLSATSSVGFGQTSALQVGGNLTVGDYGDLLLTNAGNVFGGTVTVLSQAPYYSYAFHVIYKSKANQTSGYALTYNGTTVTTTATSGANDITVSPATVATATVGAGGVLASSSSTAATDGRPSLTIDAGLGSAPASTAATTSSAATSAAIVQTIVKTAGDTTTASNPATTAATSNTIIKSTDTKPDDSIPSQGADDNKGGEKSTASNDKKGATLGNGSGTPAGNPNSGGKENIMTAGGTSVIGAGGITINIPPPPQLDHALTPIVRNELQSAIFGPR